ncbi:MAG: M28 family peptidase, partial [Bacteroidales bacterium]|nr:M28 family peptidase [Bacteroidales bacterium]
GSDLRIFGFSATDSITGEILLASTLPGENQSHVLAGKILMIPLPDDLPETAHDTYSFLRSKSLAAYDQGAKAVIFVYKDLCPSPENARRQTLQIPVIALKFDQLAGLSEFASLELFAALGEPDQSIVASGVDATIQTDVVAGKIKTFNTMARLKGSDPALSEQYIIIGAHHDHLGMGGRGSSSRSQDTVAVHYGADDNASGVAGVIELSQHLMSRSPGRSFIFTTFAAEEMGLYGSKTFAEDPPVDLSNVQAMINMDMIGRLNEERQLQIGGIGTSPVFRELIDSLNQSYDFSIAYSEAGFGPSDHASFYAKDVPVLFVSTGAHTDYHTPDDRIDRINYSGMQEVLYFISDVAYALSNLPGNIEFTMAGPKESSGSRGREGMVTFGLMPDVMYDGNEGMPVSFVTEGKPAAISGMKGGDIITEVDGKRIGNVHDYMERLSELEEGQSVIVTVLRDGEKIELLLKL